jgi:hypothetical protein
MIASIFFMGRETPSPPQVGAADPMLFWRRGRGSAAEGFNSIG